MNETLVERMGHAIGKAAIKAAKNSEETPWETIALAALRAIREPGPAVLAQVEAQINAGNPIEWAWQGGIDAAIAEAGAQE